MTMQLQIWQKVGQSGFERWCKYQKLVSSRELGKVVYSLQVAVLSGIRSLLFNEATINLASS